MKVVLLLFIGLLTELLPSHGQKSGDMAKKSADRSKDIQQSLYAVLRTMALPDGAVKKGTPVSQRFVLQVPGKLLNPLDYDPTNYSEDATQQRFTAFIPPKIEENMFRLTDVVPVANPMQGGETGESFMDMYEAVLNQLDVRGFDKKTQEDRNRYRKAIDYLAEPVNDPEDLTRNATRLDLYTRLQSRYNEVRLKMEDKIKEVRDKYEDDPVEYQVWFQTHYPPLYAEVENAYTEWLVFGEKDLVELYKAFLDVESQGVDLEEARMSLRSSGKVTLDRSSTVYPVYFEPSNWYEYLRTKDEPLTREQIQIKIGDIEARLATLESMKGTETSGDANAFIEKLEGDEEETKNQLDEATTGLDEKRLACMKATEEKAEDKNTICQEYRDSQNQVTSLSTKFASKKAKADNARFQLRSDDESKKSLDGLISNLNVQKSNLEKLLENAETTVPDVPAVTGDNDTQDFQAGWMEFSFESAARSKKVDKSAKSYAASLSFSASGVGWGVSGGASYSRAEQKFAQKISNSDIKISAKILKVSIKRPWFKTSLFKSNQFQMRYNQKVSPGPMDEVELIKILQSRSKSYLMPQFVNAFLLAKDVSLEFRGVDSSVQSRALQESASAHMSGNYGPFSASASFNYGKSESHMQAESTADGLRIKIPGAQLIGYYVTVLPCFPKNLCPSK